ncbi:hypothetical protein EDB80DRAFT_880123 [Ilyonectria destructans]|nr:hypothetical protein EDB80DRAFT_880123 [Ilyonectria destructans]
MAIWVTGLSAPTWRPWTKAVRLHFEQQGRLVGFEPGAPSGNHRLALEDEEAVSVVSDFFNVISLVQATASTAEDDSVGLLWARRFCDTAGESRRRRLNN